MVDKVVMLPVGVKAEGLERINKSAGMELREEDGKLFVDNLEFGGAAEKQKIDFDWEIASVQVSNNCPAKQWLYLIGIGLLALVIFSQKARIRRQGGVTVKHA